MKKKLSILFLFVALFITVKNTSAYFFTSNNNISTFKTKEYTLKIDANGGTFNSSGVIVNKGSVRLPTPVRNGYTFSGYSISLNGDINYSTNISNVSEINNKINYAKWNINSYLVDVNPIIEGTTYNSGLDGYTFDVWVNGNLVADDVTDWCQNISYGSTVRVRTNNATGKSTNFDKTITVGTSNVNINPTWSINTYESHFYLNGTHRLTTYNKYGSYIQTPNTNASALGYDSNFYYVSGFTSWETWYQPDRTVGFNINISEYNCTASFGSAGNNNNNYQLEKLRASGYDFCVNAGWAVECSGNYSKVMGIYNNVWNILPRSGNGYSIYKQIGCDSGWSNVARR